MASGWKFSVTVPSWTQTTLEGDEIVVFYRVEVKVLPPESTGVPRTRSVLRRYNHFIKLYSKLCQELGQRKMSGKEAPAKRSLFNVNKRPELIERRRKELQQWLWRLISDPEVAKAKMLNDFLELSDAARIVPRVTAPSSSADMPESIVEGSYGMSEGSSPRGDASSEVSGFTAASILTDRATSTRSQMPSADFAMDRSIPESSQRIALQRPSTGRGLEAMLEGEADNMRLGLRVEQRGNIKRLVKGLKHRLDTASSDLQDAVEAIHAEREAKRLLAEKVAALEARMSVNHTQREAELERLLSQEQLSSSGLRAGLDQAAREQEELKAELEAVRAAATAAKAGSDEQEKESTQLGALNREQEEERLAEAERRHKAEVDRLSQQEADARRRAEMLEAERDDAMARGEAASQEAHAAQELLAVTKTKSKADMKLLAKEVKSLRKQLAEAAQRAKQAEGEAAAAIAEQQAAEAALSALAPIPASAQAAEVHGQSESCTKASAETQKHSSQHCSQRPEVQPAADGLSSLAIERSVTEPSSSSAAAAAAAVTKSPAIKPEAHQQSEQRRVHRAALPSESSSVQASDISRPPADGNSEAISGIADPAPNTPAIATAAANQAEQPNADLWSSTAGTTQLTESAKLAAQQQQESSSQPSKALPGTDWIGPSTSNPVGSVRAALEVPSAMPSGAASNFHTEGKSYLLPDSIDEPAGGAHEVPDGDIVAAGAKQQKLQNSHLQPQSIAQQLDSSLDPSLLRPELETSSRQNHSVDARNAALLGMRTAGSPGLRDEESSQSGQDIQDSSQPTLTGSLPAVSESSKYAASIVPSQAAAHEQPGKLDEQQPPHSAANLVRSQLDASGSTRSAVLHQPEPSTSLKPGQSLEAGEAFEEGHQDPFAQSAGLDLFSGLSLSSPAVEAEQAAAGPGEENGLGDSSPAAAEAPGSTSEGLDILGLEDDMLVETSLADLGHPPETNRLAAQSSKQSSDLLSWDSDQLQAAQSMGFPDASDADMMHSKQSSPHQRLSIVPEHTSASAAMPSDGTIAQPLSSLSEAASSASGVHAQQAAAAQQLGNGNSNAKHVASASASARQESAEPPVPVSPAQQSAQGGLLGRLRGTPGQAPVASPANSQTPANSAPSSSRAVGSFMTKIGFGAQPATGSNQGAAEVPAQGSGLQSMFGGRDKIETFARGLIRKTNSGT